MIKSLQRALSIGFVSISLVACSGEATDPLAGASAGPKPSASPANPALSDTPAIREIATRKDMPMADRMDCIRENGALPAAHRGGPRKGYPENAIETLAKSYENGARIFEVDVAESKDGVLFLMHDTDLDRTTNAQGVAREMTWRQLQSVRLTANGAPTDFAIPTLKDTLVWAVENNAIVELDKKRSTDFADIIADVRATNAENHVILITYTYDQAEEVARMAPDLVMTASVEDPSDVDELMSRGVDIDNLIAWTGTQTLNPALWEELKARGVEVAFGTLGRRGDRFDDAFYEDRDPSEYRDIAAAGVTMIATDFSDRVARTLEVDDKAIRACGL